MKLLKDVINGDILYMLSSEYNQLEITIVESIEKMTVSPIDSNVFIYDVKFKFQNDDHICDFLLKHKDQNNSICLSHISGDHKYNKKMFLISTDKQTLIDFYIDKLNESIKYQETVIEQGKKQIDELNKTIIKIRNIQ